MYRDSNENSSQTINNKYYLLNHIIVRTLKLFVKFFLILYKIGVIKNKHYDY